MPLLFAGGTNVSMNRIASSKRFRLICRGRLFRCVSCIGLFISLSLASGCQPEVNRLVSGLSGKLTITGSSTVAPLVSEIARRFEQQYPQVRIDVQTGGSGKGIVDARKGVVDIGMASRVLKPDERDLMAHPIAADGVSLIVHRSNPIQQLTDQQVVDIFTGKTRNWRQLGGPDRSITVVHKAAGRATQEVFLNYFRIDDTNVRADVVVGDNQHGIKTVAGAKGAIGYVSIGTAEAESAGDVPIRLIPAGGVPATTDNVASGEFPISRPLNLVTRNLDDPLVKAFVAFCQSEEVHDQVVAQYFVPIKK